MNIDQWWPRLDASTREWLIEHNGEPVPAAMLGAIMSAGGHLTDEDVDWIEAAANGETPNGA